ncbi:amino acid adenylation domain-containing protein, partial [Dyella sp.]|uniref:amino acid adenylation domain-containing protein n=1 Tax=Dyella sp. TaxID=1869338 RepID=UPI003F80FC6D
MLELPTDRPRPSQQNHAGAIIEVKIERELTAALKHLSQAHGSTLFNTVLAAWAALLGRLSGQSEVVVGVPVANRSQPALEGLIGFFVNTLAVRLDVSPESTVTALLQHARQRMLEAQAHQDLPFELMVERIKPARSLSYSPVFQASLSWQNVEAVAPTLEDLQLQLMHGIGATAKFDVSLELGEADGCITGAFSYATALFDAATAQRHVLYFQRVLAAVAADPALQLGQIPLLDEAERRQVLEDWNATTAAYPLEQTVHGLVEAQVRRTPDAIALIAGEERVSYATLNAQANRLAHQLLALGVQPEERVALGVERSVALVVGLLAVWKAGAAYVPLDPGYPGARNRQILQEAAPRVLLLDAAGRAGLEPWPSGAAPCQVLDLDRFEGEAWPASDPSIAGRGGGQLAYVLFTSGSTGTPKGVMVEHGGLVNHGYWQVEQYGLGAQDVFLQRTSPAFDAAGWELWTPLSVGASLVLLPATAQHDAEAIMATVAAHEVSVLQLVPSLLAALPERLLAAHAGRLRYVFCGGEALSGELAARGARLAREGVINLYGPTEATIDASACRWEAAQHGEGGGVPIGRPIANTRLYILDAWGEPVPVGVRGEIHIGGAGVARGYLNQPALSAASFGPDRFHGGRMYRTGDMGRWRADGEVEYLGRNDGQVKVRGFRIEPGEIETQLLRQAGVREAAVVVREDRLVGYLVLAEEGVLATVRTQLAQHLPDYMVPAALVEVAALPRLPNGKLDRSGLPAPTAQAYAHAAYEAAQGDLERRLVQVWQGLLGLERVGRHDNFFELGGHSLLALRLLSRLREELEVELPLRELFAHPTVAGLAQAVRAAGGAVLPPVRPSGQEEAPLSYAQQRLWFIDRLEGGSVQYNLPGVFRLSGALDEAALRTALAGLLERHAVLRAEFVERDERVYQRARATVALPLRIVDLTDLPVGERETAITRYCAMDLQTPFDLRRELPLRVRLLRQGAQEHVVVFNMHHIASDGWSMGILVREFCALYAAAVEGREAGLAALPVQYADYAQWQAQWLGEAALAQEQAYWTQRLAGAPPVHGLPLDRPRPARASYRGAAQGQVLAPALSGALRALCRQADVTLFMLLQTAFAVLLGRWSNETDVVVGTAVAGRSHRELEPLIGFFVNMLALRTDLSGEPSFALLLQRSKQHWLADLEHQLLPFEALVEALKPERSLSHSPLFQVAFSLHNTEQAAMTLPGLTFTPLAQATTTAHYELELHAQEVGGTIQLGWVYNSDLFEADTIARLADSFRVLLEGIVAAPATSIARLPLASQQDLQKVIHHFNQTAQAFSENLCVHQLFEQALVRHPDAIAVQYEEMTLSYRLLNERANQLAHYLRSLGVKPDRVVALYMERSIEMVLALYAVMKAGAAYLPIDPDHPAERVRYMLDDAQADIVLTQAALQAALPDGAYRVLAVDALADTLAKESTENPDADAIGLRADHLAYVIYTSGSTGRPKGVMVPHRGVVNRIEWMQRSYPLDSQDRVLQKTPYSFDVSVWEFIWPLMAGARLVVARAQGHRDPRYLEDTIRHHGITILHFVPSMLAQMLDGSAWGELHSVRRVFCSGEALSKNHVAHYRASGTRALLHNLYGPTEASIDVSYWDCAQDHDGATIPIGRPIQNLRLYVLDPLGQPTPIGVFGQLHIGGVGLARGYLNRPELTHEKFMDNPLQGFAGDILYKTGDLARWTAGGYLEFA